MSVTLGLDLGTQGLKLIAWDGEAAAPLFVTGEPLALHEGAGGVREQQAGDWVVAATRCIQRIPAAVRERVVAIGVSGQQHGLVPLGAEGRVLAPVKLWNDTSSEADGRAIMQAAGGRDRCIALAGNPVPAGYTASKLPWTRRHRPEVYAALATILLPHDYLNYWLTGERWMECGDASGTGWLDVRTRQWSDAMLRATDADRDLRDCLPPLVAPDACVPIDPATAEHLGLPRHAVVSAGGGDNMMAAIGTGNVVPGRLTLSLGTSGTLFAHATRFVIDPEARWAAFCDSTGAWLPLVCTMNCTVATEAIAALCRIEPGERDGLVDATAPGAGGVVMLPFLNGERTPDLPLATGSLHGLTPSNFDRASLYRAAMEGATFGLRHGYDGLRDAGLAFDRVRLTGGGSRSAAWRQMVADVFDLPVEVPVESEGAALGAALQALWAHRRLVEPGLALADVVDTHVAIDPTRAARPDPRRRGAYAAAHARYLEHLDAMAPMLVRGAPPS
ncbi:xylulokinase [Lysobacter sp. SG-8]|uniref:Xylulose kinase n=1 Tax=Marilutibacter penaei TaxID=2759900 RepID=A0A7W3U357_9GAMM|nr:xylulokinase [Lysobacter penaei]